MARQLSTSVSDFALAASVFYVAYYWYNRSLIYAAAGLLLQGLAATAGVVRFGMERPEGTLIFKTHKFLSWLTAAAGLSLIAYDFCLHYHSYSMGNVVLAFSAIVLVTAAFQTRENRQLTTQACSGLAVLTVLLTCFFNTNWNGVAAALVYILAGAIIGSEGELMGLLRVDILHYALVGGNFLFLNSL